MKMVQCGLSEVRQNRFDVVITDLRLPKATGIEILSEVKKIDPDCPVIIMTAYASVDTAVQALQQGAFDYLTKPFSPDKLLARLKHLRQLQEVLEENTALKRRIRGFEKRVLVGNSPAIQKLVEMIELVRQERDDGAHRGRERHREGTRGPGAPQPRARARRAPSSPSTAASFRRTSSRAPSSATRRALSRAPMPGTSATSNAPAGGRSSSTKSMTSPISSRSSCCGSCKSGSSSGSEEPSPSRSTSA